MTSSKSTNNADAAQPTSGSGGEASSLSQATPDMVADTTVDTYSAEVENLSDLALDHGPVKLAKYSDLFEKLLDPTMLVDANDFRILSINPVCERMLRTPGTELLKENLPDLAVDAVKDKFQLNLRRARRKFYPTKFETIWQSKDGKNTFLMEIMACLMNLSDGSKVLQIIARDITNQREMEMKLEELSSTDELTRLSNIRHFKTVARAEHDRCARYDRPYSIILCDVDNFKNYNDQHGHPAGDKLLATFGRIFADTVRSSDQPARYGGEEFIVLCPETDGDAAHLVAERLRNAIRSYPFDHAEEQPLGKISISLGVATFPQHGSTMDEMIESADRGLYLSKEAGRDRVSVVEAIASVPERSKREKPAGSTLATVLPLVVAEPPAFVEDDPEAVALTKVPPAAPPSAQRHAAPVEPSAKAPTIASEAQPPSHEVEYFPFDRIQPDADCVKLMTVDEIIFFGASPVGLRRVDDALILEVVFLDLDHEEEVGRTVKLLRKRLKGLPIDGLEVFPTRQEDLLALVENFYEVPRSKIFERDRKVLHPLIRKVKAA